MNRIIGIVSAMLLSLLILVPAAVAADPWDTDEHFVFTSGGDITLSADEYADLLVVAGGTATIEGNARAVVVLSGTANFIGGRTEDVFVVAGHVSLDGGSVVAGNIRTVNSTVDQASGAIVQGRINDGLDIAAGIWLIGPALFIAYMGFVIAAMAAAVALAALASRQVRAAEALISEQPVMTFLAGFGGLFAIIFAAVLAMVTIVGIPLGLGILIGFLPVVAFVGYLVTGIWIGEAIVGRASSGVVRERPYLAAAVGTAALGVIGLIPFAGSLVSLVGVGAVLMLMGRAVRRPASAQASSGSARATAAG
jgi:hypothetical protein